jgi:hypothetical protein
MIWTVEQRYTRIVQHSGVRTAEVEADILEEAQDLVELDDVEGEYHADEDTEGGDWDYHEPEYRRAAE